ncbi:hypothetical protein V6N13_025194 [Hibiscus sabdariffa]
MKRGVTTWTKDVTTLRVSTILKMTKGKEKVEVVDESLPQDYENLLKLQDIESKLDDVESNLTKLLCLCQDMEQIFCDSNYDAVEDVVVAASNVVDAITEGPDLDRDTRLMDIIEAANERLTLLQLWCM